MALNPKFLRAVGTSFTPLYLVGANIRSTVNTLKVTNRTAASVILNIQVYILNASGTNVVLVRNEPLAGNASYVHNGVLTLKGTDSIQVKSSAASSLDVDMLALERNTTDSPVPDRHFLRNLGATTSELYKPTVAAPAMEYLRITNITAGPVVFSVEKYPSDVAANNVYHVKEQTLQAGKSFVSDGPIGFETTDSLQITSDTAASLDVMAGVLEP